MLNSFNILLLFALFLIMVHASPYNQNSAFAADRSEQPLTPTYGPTSIISPSLKVLQWNRECDDGLYTMYTAESGTREAGAAILDSKGKLVWWNGNHNQVQDLRVQAWRGKQHLTFWAAEDPVNEHDVGYFHILDSSYNEVLKFPAALGPDGHPPDFQITERGTALIVVYEVISTNISSLDKSTTATIYDSLFQEIDISSNSQPVLFEWRTSDHYDISDTKRAIGSVDKDAFGNYLVSSKYMRSITYISGSTGKLVWTLGSNESNFTDVSNGRASDFTNPQGVRWLDSSTITLFDLAAGSTIYPRGMKIKLDTAAMTVKLVAEYVNPSKIIGIKEGSMQVLPSSNILLGYGSGAASEFAPNGTLLCEVHHAENKEQSSRVYKSSWHGYPTTAPDVRLVSSKNGTQMRVYVSWNGDTEVRKWVLQGAEALEREYGAWQDLQTEERLDFETIFDLPYPDMPYLRVFGLGPNGDMLGLSQALQTDQGPKKQILSLRPTGIDGEKPLPLKFLWSFLFFTAAFVAYKEYQIYRTSITPQRPGPRILRWKPLECEISID